MREQAEIVKLSGLIGQYFILFVVVAYTNKGLISALALNTMQDSIIASIISRGLNNFIGNIL